MFPRLSSFLVWVRIILVLLLCQSLLTALHECTNYLPHPSLPNQIFKEKLHNWWSIATITLYFPSYIVNTYKLNYIHTQEYIVYSHLLPVSPHILLQLSPCSLLPFTLPQSSVFKREKKNDHLSLSTLFTLNCKEQNRLDFIHTFHFSQNFLLKEENRKSKKGNYDRKYNAHWNISY